MALPRSTENSWRTSFRYSSHNSLFSLRLTFERNRYCCPLIRLAMSGLSSFWIAIYGIGRSLSMLISSIREFWLTSPAAAANKTIEHRWSLPTRIDSIIIVSSNSSSGAIWNIIIKIIITEFAVDKFDSVNDQRQSPMTDKKFDSLDDQRKNPYTNNVLLLF